MNMYCGIYKISNKTNSKVYIGSTSNFERRKRDHFRNLNNKSHINIKLQNSFNKHGENNFEFTIIEKHLIGEMTTAELFALETKWMNHYNSKKCGYNIADACGGDMITNHPNEKEIRKTAGESLSKTMQSMTQKERSLKYGKFGKDNKNYGIPRSQETLNKMSKSMSGEKHWFHGKTLSKDHIEKIALKNKGKKRTEQVKQLFSSQKSGGKNPMAVSCIVDGIKYQTITEAAKHFNLQRRTISKRCKSDDFPTWLLNVN